MDGFGLPVGSVRVGATRRYLRDVLLDSGDDPSYLLGQAVIGRLHPHLEWTFECDVHLESDQHNPAGPFVDDSTSAFVCPVAQGGAIDPSVFIAADGSPWLLWKSDGDCCGLPTIIYSQQLAPDGLSVVGPANRLIGASQPWEGGLVEGPSMLESGGTFWLFYSANLWGTDHYGIGVAHCASVTGPCTKSLDHAWLSSTESGGQSDPGPGGQEFFQVGGLIWMVHHGLAPGQSGNLAQRRLYVDLLAFPNGQPPRTAQGDPAAALAEGVLYNEDPDLPLQPQAAYLLLLHKSGAFSDDSTRASLRQDCKVVAPSTSTRMPNNFCSPWRIAT